MSDSRSPGVLKGRRTFAGWALLFVGAFVLAGAAAALAFWTLSVNNGSGSYAAAQATSLSAPTTPTATPNGGGSITVGWTLPGSQLPGAQYQVIRTSPGSPTSVCTVASTATSCQDTGLTSNTLYGYSIRAVLDNWQSSAITTSATTAAPNFVITLSSGPYTAGTAATVQTMKAMIGANVDTTYSGAKTITWSGLPNSPSNHAPSYPSSPVTFTNGVANPSSSFTAYAAGSNTLTATDASAAAVTGSTSFTVAAAGANSFTVANPGSQTAGTAFSDTITASDPYGNAATSYTGAQAITFSGPANSPNATAPTYPASVTFASGVGTALGITLTDAQSTTLTATQGSATGTSTSFTVAGAGAHSFTVANPGSQTAGTAFSDTITASDPYGNAATSYTGAQAITFSGPANSPNATAPTYPASVTFASGVGTTSGITLTDAQSTTLTATQGSATGTSTSFTVASGAGAAMAFTTQTTGVANSSKTATFTVQPVVTVQDAYGNTAVSWAQNVTLAISGGQTLTCTSNPVTPSSGVAMFAGCHGSNFANGLTLTASSTGLTSVTSTGFNITNVASKLVFTAEPSATATAGSAFTAQPVVTVEDSGGNVVTADSSSTMTLTASGGTGTLTCDNNSVTVSLGVATFTGCSIDKSGTYTIKATDGSLTVNAAPKTVVSAGAASQVAFTTQPNGGANGANWRTQPKVSVEDSLGNLVNSTASVTLSMATQPVGNTATLSCTGGNSKSAVAGVATFSGCNIVGPEGTYTLTATATGLTSATSNNLTITVGPATQLVFTTQPGGGSSGVVWSVQPVVTVEDSGGNTVTTSNASVTLSINTQPGTGATLACTGGNSKAASSGVATFAGCKITGTAGSSYSLKAAAGPPPPNISGTSNQFSD